MTDTLDLAGLAARCEAATGPDRELDAAIHGVIGDDFRRMQIKCLGAFGPEYTASLDAAMTLVPEGWDWKLYAGCATDEFPLSCSAGCAPTDSDVQTADTDGAWAATPALALCAAALRARAQQEPTHGHD